MTAAEVIRNWDRSRTWRPDTVHHPRDEEEVARVVRRAATDGRRVKPIGGALSWSDAADVPAEAMRFDRMARIDVDRDAMTVTVGAGARLDQVNDTLAEHGLALDNFGSIVMQTVGGYLGTGSHGTGARTPILASMVTRMRLVDGEGGVHELDAEHEPEIFRAARVHLGCLGVVTEVTLRCVAAFDLEERLELVPFDDVLADLDLVADRDDYVKLWWLPYTDEVQVWRFNRTDRPRTPRTLQERLDGAGVSGRLFAGLLAASRVAPAATPSITRLVQATSFSDHVRVDRSDRIIRYAGAIPRHQESEYAVPREHAAETIDRLRQAVLAGDYRVNFPMEVRWVAADDCPMSPTSGRDSTYVGAYVASRRWTRAYTADLEAIAADHGGRPHWGKDFTLSAAELRARYPGYDDFDALRRRLDPHGVFANAFTGRVFGPA